MAQARREAQVSILPGTPNRCGTRQQEAASADEFLSRARETLRQETAQARQQLRQKWRISRSIPPARFSARKSVPTISADS